MLETCESHIFRVYFVYNRMWVVLSVAFIPLYRLRSKASLSGVTEGGQREREKKREREGGRLRRSGKDVDENTCDDAHQVGRLLT